MRAISLQSLTILRMMAVLSIIVSIVSGDMLHYSNISDKVPIRLPCGWDTWESKSYLNVGEIVNMSTLRKEDGKKGWNDESDLFFVRYGEQECYFKVQICTNSGASATVFASNDDAICRDEIKNRAVEGRCANKRLRYKLTLCFCSTTAMDGKDMAGSEELGATIVVSYVS